MNLKESIGVFFLMNLISIAFLLHSQVMISQPGIGDRKLSWQHCERPICKLDGDCALKRKDREVSNQNCCSDVLFAHLQEVYDILKQVDPQVFIMYGTLLGSVRDTDIIPWETDVDIVLNASAYVSWESWKHKLEKRGFIVFQYDILRVCKMSKRPTSNNKPPWEAHSWFPYVDLYKMSLDHGFIKTNQGVTKYPQTDILPLGLCEIRNNSFLCPTNAGNVLTRFYGNWKIPKPNHHRWRKSALKK